MSLQIYFAHLFLTGNWNAGGDKGVFPKLWSWLVRNANLRLPKPKCKYTNNYVSLYLWGIKGAADLCLFNINSFNWNNVSFLVCYLLITGIIVHNLPEGYELLHFEEANKENIQTLKHFRNKYIICRSWWLTLLTKPYSQIMNSIYSKVFLFFLVVSIKHACLSLKV